MNVWLDDERPMPQGYDLHVQTAQEAIQLLSQGGVARISLDHDLGEHGGTGYDVACYIEHGAYNGTLEPIEVLIHSANPVGRDNIRRAVAKAYEYWGSSIHSKQHVDCQSLQP